MSKRPSSEEVIAVQDIVLEYILSNDWKDYEDFARFISGEILGAKPLNEASLLEVLNRISHAFFSFNDISKKGFVQRFPTTRIINRLRNMPAPATVGHVMVVPPQAKEKSKVTFDQIFPEVNEVELKTAKSLIDSLDMKERVLQDALRDALRQKGATNMVERKSDTSLEIADLEDFTLNVNGVPTSFASVIKGYRSITGKKISFEDIAHQIMKANDTNPDHILLVLAKPLKDGVISRLVKYGKDCGNRDLVIVVDQVRLAQFLRIQAII